ncbi:MAG: DNA primase [Deltaproteobacteria bacterium]|nr:DNA primase [Deltaproteobacteria bacterium]
MFPKSFLNELRERLPIASYIQERIPLKRAGRNFKGVCPFHQEKTPSFMVSDDKAMYHCFGCGEGGDIIRFCMHFEGLSFPEAVKYLAGRAGMKLPELDAKAHAKELEHEKNKKWCLRLNEIARDYFVVCLAKPVGKGCRDYLEKRGVEPKKITQHFLGFADKEWDGLVRHLQKKGAPLSLASEIGLLRRKDNGDYFDFFRNRLIFPILSPRGEVMAFGGRALEDGEPAKYLNSPDSVLYHKSNAVYGLYEAQGAIRNRDQVIVVEGYMDVLSLMQAGVENVVAPLGTALTEGHVRLLSRYTKHITLVLDGDEAGGRAMARALPLFLDVGLSPRAAMLPKGEDPDTFVKKFGGAAFEEMMSKATTLFEFFIDWTVAKTASDTVGRVEATQQILPLIARVKDSVEQSMYLKKLAERLRVDLQVLEKALREKSRAKPVASTLAKKDVRWNAHASERMLLHVMLRVPHVVERVFTQLTPNDFADEWCRDIARMIETEWKQKGSLNVGAWIEELEDSTLTSELRRMAIAEDDEEENTAPTIVDDCIEAIQRKMLEEKMRRLNEEIQQAEARRDEPTVMRLLKAKQELSAAKPMTS